MQADGNDAARNRPMSYYMPRIDAWIAARTLPEGKATTGALWRDWAAFVGDPDMKGLALEWRCRSMHGALKARGYGFKKSGQRFVTGISLRPAGELAPSAPAGTGGGNVL